MVIVDDLRKDPAERSSGFGPTPGSNSLSDPVVASRLRNTGSSTSLVIALGQRLCIPGWYD